MIIIHLSYLHMSLSKVSLEVSLEVEWIIVDVFLKSLSEVGVPLQGLEDMLLVKPHDSTA